VKIVSPKETYSFSFDHIPFALFAGTASPSPLTKSNPFMPSKQSPKYSSTFSGLLPFERISRRA
jgi:hypothetical protein